MKILFLILNILIISFSAHSQNKFILTRHDSLYKNDAGVTKFLSSEIISAKVNGKVFTFSQLNPYNKLKYKVFKKDEQHNYIYILDSNNVKELIHNDLKSYMPDRRKLNYKHYVGTSHYDVNITADSNHLAIIFYFRIMDSSHINTGFISNIRLIDSKGKIIFSEDHISNLVQYVEITNNEKCISYSYGADDEDGSLTRFGYKIINIKTGKVIIDNTCISTGFPNIVDNLIVNRCYETSNNVKNTIYLVYDSDNNFFYTKSYIDSRTYFIKEIRKDGFLIYDKLKNTTRLDSFNNFEKHE